MRSLVPVLLLLIPQISWAYLPPGPELMERMHSTLWGRAHAVEILLHIEDPRGGTREERVIRFPLAGETGARGEGSLLSSGILSFSSLSAGPESVSKILPSLFLDESAVRLARLDRTICYLIEGEAARIWIRREDYLPLRLDILAEDGLWFSSRFGEPVAVADGLVYPSLTEIYRGEELMLVEKLVLPVDETTP